jgi:hypothetical protein
VQIRILVAIGFCVVVPFAKASDVVSGANFVVSHPTEIGAIGVYDGGTAFTSDDTVGVFNTLTGNLVGSELLFGPGIPGNQVGNDFYESVPPFLLAPGDYSIVELSSTPTGGPGLSGGNSYQNLGNTVNLPGGGRFNSGSSFEISGGENTGSSASSRGFDLVDPPVPDGAVTALLLSGALTGLCWLRRKV